MKEASNNKTPDWTLNDLEDVLKGLKKDKCRDPFGYINEIFKPDVCGEDLKLAILKLMNSIKDKQEYPKCYGPKKLSMICMKQDAQMTS